jgi:CheY-like chemotaxis protein
MEVGATWSQSLRPLAIVVPPVSFIDVTRTVGQIQAWEITNHAGLQEVRESIAEALGLDATENHIFDRKRERWKADLEVRLQSLAPATKVSASAYAVATDEKREITEKLALAEKEIVALKSTLKALECLRPVAMIIEDEPLIALDLSQILEDAGFVVCGIARTEKDAVELALRTRPDILIADIQLADGSSGMDAVQKIIPLVDCYPVFVTAFPERLLKGPRPEPARLITKPFSKDLVVSIVKKAYADLVAARDRRNSAPGSS